MANNALYFPYIDMPQNRFTNTALLYWDKIFTIAPRYTEYELKPENQNHLLIKGKVIDQIHPEDYAINYPRFGTNFIKLIDDLDLPRIYPRPGGWAATANAKRTAARIHTGKILTPDLYGMLLGRNLLIEPTGSRLMVEPITADLFMHYLSQCLAQDSKLNCFPVTDEPFDPARIGGDRDAIRLRDEHFTILNQLLPVTADLLAPEEILKLSTKHHEQRVNFRKSIETFLNVDLALIKERSEREVQIHNFIIRKREEIREIQRRLQEFSKASSKSERIAFAALGFLTTGLAAIDLLHGGHSLPHAVMDVGFGGTMIYAARNAVKDLREGGPDLQRDMAFAALIAQPRESS
jgi:hypothetical protein